MILVIAEKPIVAQSIANVLGASSRKDGYLEGNNYIVSWCVGHLVGLADASSYDERFAKWRYSDLPIVPEEWLFEVPKDKQKQFKVLRDLMRDKRVTELVCATDAGREGELIFRLVYKKAGCTKGGIFGVEKADWVAELEKQNPLKAAEMSLEDDYGMIDGIINNGPKEDKASEKGEKTSIMDRLKSAKTAQQTDKPSPHKEKKSERVL